MEHFSNRMFLQEFLVVTEKCVLPLLNTLSDEYLEYKKKVFLNGDARKFHQDALVFLRIFIA